MGSVPAPLQVHPNIRPPTNTSGLPDSMAKALDRGLDVQFREVATAVQEGYKSSHRVPFWGAPPRRVHQLELARARDDEVCCPVLVPEGVPAPAMHTLPVKAPPVMHGPAWGCSMSPSTPAWEQHPAGGMVMSLPAACQAMTGVHLHQGPSPGHALAMHAAGQLRGLLHGCAAPHPCMHGVHRRGRGGAEGIRSPTCRPQWGASTPGRRGGCWIPRWAPGRRCR